MVGKNIGARYSAQCWEILTNNTQSFPSKGLQSASYILDPF